MNNHEIIAQRIREINEQVHSYEGGTIRIWCADNMVMYGWDIVRVNLIWRGAEEDEPICKMSCDMERRIWGEWDVEQLRIALKEIIDRFLEHINYSTSEWEEELV